MLRDSDPEWRRHARGYVETFAEGFIGLCESIELAAAAQHLRFIRDDLAGGLLDSDSKLADRIDQALRSFREDLEERHFFRVTAGKKPYFGADFGEAVTKAFPSAAFDIREGNTCFALERYVAAILHLIRASEVALHALAKERGIASTKPIAWEEWQAIIIGIHNSVDAEAKGMGRGPKKDAFLHFYSGALGEFTALKDVYRNVLVHTRPKKKMPGERDAQDAIVAARGLFQRLSTKLTEKGRQIKWK